MSSVPDGEVEETIYQLPPASEVAVVGVPHPRWVQAVIAVVVLKAVSVLNLDVVARRSRQRRNGRSTR